MPTKEIKSLPAKKAAGKKAALPVVVLIGRANVGKSSIFNKSIDKHKAIVSEIAGTTRDINEGIVYWNKAVFELIDTGGIETIVPKKTLKAMAPKANELFVKEIMQKSHEALKRADIILFVTDFKDGVMPADIELARNLRMMGKELILVINKVDSYGDREHTAEFHRLGIDDVAIISAMRGLGFGDLLEDVANRVMKMKKKSKVKQIVFEEIQPDLKIAIVGRPNVGKSSLFNKLINEDKAIVSPIAGTTREAKDTMVTYGDKHMLFVDTAGLRKNARMREDELDEASLRKTVAAVKQADIAFLVLDSSNKVTTQDKKIAALLIENDVAILIVANKWDLIEDKSTNTIKKVEEDIRWELPFMHWAPIIFVSAKTGKGTQNIYSQVMRLNERRFMVIPDDELKRFIKSAIKHQRPITDRGTMPPRIIDFIQTGTNPPKFAIQIRPTDRLSENYLRYLEKQLRMKFDLEGTKIWISVKK